MPSYSRNRRAITLAVGACISAAAAAHARSGAAFESIPSTLDSGIIADLPLDEHDVVFSAEVRHEGASWLRLHFGDVKLGPWSYLQITSLEDGGTQVMSEEHLDQWNFSTAVFNGEAVLLEVVSQGGGGENRITIAELSAGLPLVEPQSICFGIDDRELSADPRIGRTFPNGCTAWMIDDCHRCMITAGHCSTGFDIVQFNVPLSNGNGSWNNPPPQHQYPVDFTSMQKQSSGIGADWAYFGCFPNSTTAMLPGEAQGDAFTLANPPTGSGHTIRITGFGSVQPPVPNQWDFAQKTHTGPFSTQSSPTTVKYQVDTTGGNSGSPVILESTGAAIGVHTHAGCNIGGGANQGTAITQSSFSAALASPKGVCCPGSWSEPPGAFALLSPANATEGLDPDAVVLDWADAEGAQSYTVNIGANPFGTATIFEQATTATEFAIPAGVLVHDEVYFWRILAVSGTASTPSTPAVLGFFTAPEASGCPADLDATGSIDSADLNIMLAAFGAGSAGDTDSDGDTDSTDLNALLAVFGADCAG